MENAMGLQVMILTSLLIGALYIAISQGIRLYRELMRNIRGE